MRRFDFLCFLLLFVLFLPFGLCATLNGSSSIYSFNVTNCQSDYSNVSCPPITIRFSCDVTNKQFIDFIEFRINGSLYNASFVGFNARYDFSKPNQTSTVNTTIDFDRIYITDTNGDTAVFDDNVSVLHDCVTCTDVGYADNCSVFDNTTFHHLFEPVNCSVDYNETVSCNYCSENLLQTLGDCNVSDLQTVDWSDLNYFSCCAVTGLGSDCSILVYPYNETTSQACDYLVQDFECNIPSLAEFDDRMTFSCILPDNDDYKCVVKVLEDDRIVQVNPESAEYNVGLLGNKRTETKEFFESQNSILNAYFTKKNLLTEKSFLVEVECASDSDVYVYQELVEPFYEDLNFVANRGVWFNRNIKKIFGFVLGVIVLVIGIAWIIAIARRNAR